MLKDVSLLLITQFIFLRNSNTYLSNFHFYLLMEGTLSVLRKILLFFIMSLNYCFSYASLHA